MAEKPTPPADSEAERRFQETLTRLVNTPHKPHAPPKGAGITRAPKKAASVSDTAEYQALRDAVLAAQAAS